MQTMQTSGQEKLKSCFSLSLFGFALLITCGANDGQSRRPTHGNPVGYVGANAAAGEGDPLPQNAEEDEKVDEPDDSENPEEIHEFKLGTVKTSKGTVTFATVDEKLAAALSDWVAEVSTNYTLTIFLKEGGSSAQSTGCTGEDKKLKKKAFAFIDIAQDQLALIENFSLLTSKCN